MRGHVVQTFGFMNIAIAVLRRDFLEKTFQIRLDIRIGVLLNEQRGRGVAAENRQEAGRDVLLAKPARHFRADLDKTLAAGLNVQAMERLAHRKGCRLEAVAIMPAANVPHFEIARAAIFIYFYVSEREIRSRPKLCGKNAAPPRVTRKNRVQADTFSSLSRD